MCNQNYFIFLTSSSAQSSLTAPAAGVSEALTAALVSCGVGVLAVPGGVCGQRSVQRLQGTVGLRVKAEAPLVQDGASPCIWSLSTLHAFVPIHLYISVSIPG